MQIDPSKKYHLVGIGGDGMSALALVLLKLGATVVGSDIQQTDRGSELRKAGAEVYVGHQQSHLARDTDEVIVSSAISSDNPEIRRAGDLNIPVRKRLTALADLMEKSKSIGIAGTHGKSTTTTMAAALLEFGGLDPTYLIGAECDRLGGNAKVGGGEHFLAEVDESDGYFLQLEPEIGVVTNVGKDHLDTYRDEEEIVRGFVQFVKNSQRQIICADDSHSDRLIRASSDPLTIGIGGSADLKATGIEHYGFDTYFDLSYEGQHVGQVRLPAPGRHNVYNALAAMAVGSMVGLNFSEMIDLLEEVQLPKRRFQILRNNGTVVIDDYAHLPEEIEVTLEAVRNGWDPDRIVALFQPHRFSRTKHINGQFGSSFRLADLVVVTGIYPACESPIPGITSQLVFKSIQEQPGSNVHRILDTDQVYSFLRRHLNEGDFLVGLGAGDIWKVTHKLSDSKVAA